MPEPTVPEPDSDQLCDNSDCICHRISEPEPEVQPLASTSDTALRDRLAEALNKWTLNAAGTARTSPPVHPRTLENLHANSLARADAVLPVVEAEIADLRRALATQIGLYKSAEEDVDKAEAALAEQTQRAEQAEAEAASAWQNAEDWNEIANGARLGRQQAEDAIARVRNVMAYKTMLAGPDAEQVVRVADLEAALDRGASSTWQARAEQAERALAAIHEGETEPPAERPAAVYTPGEWLHWFNRADPAERLATIERIYTATRYMSACITSRHEERLQQDEAAVHGVRKALEPSPTGRAFAIHRGGEGETHVQVVVPRDAILAALDQSKELT
ncbi:hypothetical protein [Actinomadura decatromicini]|uniref:Uncharacterized protein n=1 Tax=Actinomadura decatromicini TaxID=2604572 RepID=A0A5D3FCZ1_9ACTN|nr:hypothetical protein [Actinomadura decatromicini]TYK45185.1 hypothetical protein FXF68_31395 [Actinomadura decatromicini]